jgi:hypothetical protein
MHPRRQTLKLLDLITVRVVFPSGEVIVTAGGAHDEPHGPPFET